jgi:hypothetical protein
LEPLFHHDHQPFPTQEIVNVPVGQEESERSLLNGAKVISYMAQERA